MLKATNDGTRCAVVMTAALVLGGGATVQADGLRAWLDGTQFATGPGSQLWSHGDNIGIGQVAQYTKFHDGVATGNHGLTGLIDEVRVYNRVLNNSEIQILFDGNSTEGTSAPKAPNNMRILAK